jgi:hypothetical protein
MSSRIERLNNWVDSLTIEEFKKSLVECVDELIDFEYVNFYDSSPAPYWATTGDYIDGKEYDNE